MSAGRYRSGRPVVRAAACVLAVSLAGLAACDDDGGRAQPDTSPASVGPTATTTDTTTPTVRPTVSVYLLRNGVLGVARRAPAATGGIERAALEQVLLPPTDAERAAGLTSAVPAGTRVLSFAISGTTATVDLSREFETGAGSTSTLGRLAQVTFTLTQFPTVTGVVFRVEGKDVTVFGREGLVLTGAQTRTSFDPVLPRLLVETPAPGDIVTSPLRVAGLNNTFENNVRIRLRRGDGTVLVDTFTTGTGRGIGTWGPFAATITFGTGSGGDATLEVFDVSAETGQPTGLVSIPVRLGG